MRQAELLFNILLFSSSSVEPHFYSEEDSQKWGIFYKASDQHPQVTRNIGRQNYHGLENTERKRWLKVIEGGLDSIREHSRKGRALALHMIDQSSIPGMPYGPLSLTGIITGCRALQALGMVPPNKNKNKQKKSNRRGAQNSKIAICFLHNWLRLDPQHPILSLGVILRTEPEVSP